MSRTKSIKYNKSNHTFIFSGDLGDALKKAQKDIDSNRQYLDYYEWNYQRAKREYDSRLNKIKLNQDFIDCVKTQEPNWFDDNGKYIRGSYEKKYMNNKNQKENENG